MSADTWLVVGLGNPGPRYELTRHNVGQLVLDVLSDRIGTDFRSHKTNSRTAEGRLEIGGPRVVLAKPNSFMNLSGGPVAALSKYFGVPVERTILVHDELDLPFGSLRLKQGGGHGGHNGLRDAVKALDSADFLRVRVGIDRPPGQQSPADYVLRPFSGAEQKELAVNLEEAADAVTALITDGLVSAQQRFHRR